MSEAASRLVREFDRRVAQKMRDAWSLDIGTVGADMSLQLATFTEPIPHGEYLVNRALTLPNPMAQTWDATEPDGGDDAKGGHTHTDVLHVHDVIALGAPTSGPASFPAAAPIPPPPPPPAPPTISIAAGAAFGLTTSATRHNHDVMRPAQFDPLKPGDTVLVGIIRAGAEFVVICVLAPSGVIPNATNRSPR